MWIRSNRYVFEDFDGFQVVRLGTILTVGKVIYDNSINGYKFTTTSEDLNKHTYRFKEEEPCRSVRAELVEKLENYSKDVNYSMYG